MENCNKLEPAFGEGGRARGAAPWGGAPLGGMHIG